MSAEGKRKKKPTTKAAQTEAGHRGGRTAVQGGAGYAIAELIDSFVELDGGQVALVAVILTALFAYVQTLVEEALGAGLLRRVEE